MQYYFDSELKNILTIMTSVSCNSQCDITTYLRMTVSLTMLIFYLNAEKGMQYI